MKQNSSRDWSEALAAKVKDAEMQPSDELWSRIEMSTTPTIISRPRLLSWVSGMAAAIVVGLFAVNVWFGDRVVDAIIPQETAEMLVSQGQEQITAPSVEKPQLPNPVTPTVEIKKEYIALNDNSNNAESREVENTAPIKKSRKVETSAAHKPSTRAKQSQSRHQRSSMLSNEDIIKYNQENSEPQRRESHAMTLAMNVGGGVSNNGISSQQPMGIHDRLMRVGYQSTMMATGYADIPFEELYANSTIKHSQPLSFALAVSRELSHGLSFESGLNYTILNSEVAHSTYESPLDQKIQFLGVPLRLNYNIFSSNYFSLYTSAGVMGEYCLSAKVGHNNMNEKRWHLSAGAALGAEYKLSKWLGLYCEPDLSYYFTKTRLESIRNEQPAVFNLRVGLRFAL